MSSAGEPNPKPKKTSKSYYYHSPGSGVDKEKEINDAMRQVEKAMGQVRMAEKEMRKVHKYAGATGNSSTQAGGQPKMGKGDGMMFINHTMASGGVANINIQSAQNIQVGSHNTMVINNSGSKRSSGRRKKPSYSSSSSDSDSDEDLRKQGDGATATLGEAERRILASERLATRDDMITVCEHVGNWRRFLRLLGLTDTELEHIHQDETEGVKQKLFEGMKLWQRKNPECATIGVLATKLKSIGLLDALQHLQP